MNLSCRNYKTRALEGMAKIVAPNWTDRQRNFAEQVRSLLENAQVFVLPPGGFLYENKGSYAEEFGEIRLPYQEVVFECHDVPMTDMMQDLSDATRPVTKVRNLLLLAWYSPTTFHGVESNALNVTYLMVDAARSIGVIPEVTSFLLHEDGLIGAPVTVGKMFADEVSEETFYREAELFTGETYGMDKWTAYLFSSEGKFLEILTQACLVLMSPRITSVEHSAPERLNRKRVRKGRLPLYAYHTIELPDEERKRLAGLGVHHASPRFHFRRGHVRHLHQGGVTWVRDCVVGDPTLGVVEKEYHVRRG